MKTRLLQDELETTVMRMQEIVEAKHRQDVEADDLFRSLVQWAFRGEL
jgi:hypothetical protein